MKTTLILLTIIMLASCKSNNEQQPKNTDLIQQNLKSLVKQTIDTPYKVDSSGNIGAQDSCCVETQELNDSGYVTKYYTKDIKGNTKMDQTFIHNPNGSLKEFTTMNDGKPSNHIVIASDDNGNYKAAESYDSTGKQDGYYTDFKQNDFGELTNLKLYKTDSTLKYMFESQFDNNAQYLGGHTDSAGKTIFSNATTLDSNSNAVKVITTTMVKDSAKQDTSLYRYDQYDEVGNWIQRTTLNASGKPTKVTKRGITYYKKE